MLAGVGWSKTAEFSISMLGCWNWDADGYANPDLDACLSLAEKAEQRVAMAIASRRSGLLFFSALQSGMSELGGEIVPCLDHFEAKRCGFLRAQVSASIDKLSLRSNVALLKFRHSVSQNRSLGGGVWESNTPFGPRRTESPALKAGKVTGPFSPPRQFYRRSLE
jgi:hypothetical protein